MNTPVLLRFALLLAMAALVASWFHAWSVRRGLERDLAVARSQQARLKERRLQPRPATVMADAAAQPVPPAQIDASSTPATAAPADLLIGQWLAAKDWRPHGRFAVRDALATLLAAAAGGDLAALRSVLEIEGEARTRAVAFHANLPPEVRTGFASPEDLVASATAMSIPLTSAQLFWLNEYDADHAVAGIMLAAPPDEPTPTAAPPEPNTPPMSNGHASRVVLLNLHRTNNEWRVVVPAGAIDGLARNPNTPRRIAGAGGS